MFNALFSLFHFFLFCFLGFLIWKHHCLLCQNDTGAPPTSLISDCYLVCKACVDIANCSSKVETMIFKPLPLHYQQLQYNNWGWYSILCNLLSFSFLHLAWIGINMIILTSLLESWSQQRHRTPLSKHMQHYVWIARDSLQFPWFSLLVQEQFAIALTFSL